MEMDWGGIRLGDFESNFMDEEFQKRLRKTLYYGKNPLTERTSLPVTELAVELLQSAAPKELGKIDTQLAASISRKACISPCSLMLGLIYIDRLRQKSPEYLQQVSSADLFLIAMMVASKFLHDDGEDGVYNDEWAESAGLGTDTVNTLEREFLQAIDWNLLARGKEFEKKLEQLEHSVALRKGKERLWKLSYTDLWVFLRNLECLQLIKTNVQECIKIFGAVLSAYVLGVAVLWVSLSTVTAARSKICHEELQANTVKSDTPSDDHGLASNPNEYPMSRNVNLQSRKNTEDDTAISFDSTYLEPSTPLPTHRRQTCCLKWKLFLKALEDGCHHQEYKKEISRDWPFCNCNENAVCRNVKIKENGSNFAFAQEKINNSWVDFGLEKLFDRKIRVPPLVSVFG